MKSVITGALGGDEDIRAEAGLPEYQNNNNIVILLVKDLQGINLLCQNNVIQTMLGFKTRYYHKHIASTHSHPNILGLIMLA